jgi:hypothetical protein
MQVNGRKLTLRQRQDLVYQLILTYEMPSERVLTHALHELGVNVSHTSVSRLCRAIGVYRQVGTCGADPYLTSRMFKSQQCPSTPLWYLYARIGSRYYRGLRSTEDRNLLQRANRLTRSRQAGDEVTVKLLEEEFEAMGHRWWR